MAYEQDRVPVHVRILRAAVFTLSGAAVVCFYLWLFIFVFKWESPKSYVLRKQNARWEARAALANRNLELCEQTLDGISQRGNEVYRSIYGLAPVRPEFDYAMASGLPEYEELASEGASPYLRRLVIKADEIKRNVSRQGRALDEVETLAMQSGDMISCVPGVPPIYPDPSTYKLSSLFGYRRDPMNFHYAFHSGIDFSTRKGNPVYVTGDGVVEKVRYQFSGYGNEVTVNHGYGYRSHYAHLSTIDVPEGAHVTRGQKIATVGNTGKSTGPHLHYEVIYRGNTVNPLNYMDLEMPLDEYRSMIATRDGERPRFRKKSNSEILRRTK